MVLKLVRKSGLFLILFSCFFKPQSSFGDLTLDSRWNYIKASLKSRIDFYNRVLLEEIRNPQNKMSEIYSLIASIAGKNPSYLPDLAAQGQWLDWTKIEEDELDDQQKAMLAAFSEINSKLIQSGLLPIYSFMNKVIGSEERSFPFPFMRDSLAQLDKILAELKAYSSSDDLKSTSAQVFSSPMLVTFYLEVNNQIFQILTSERSEVGVDKHSQLFEHLGEIKILKDLTSKATLPEIEFLKELKTFLFEMMDPSSQKYIEYISESRGDESEEESNWFKNIKVEISKAEKLSNKDQNVRQMFLDLFQRMTRKLRAEKIASDQLQELLSIEFNEDLLMRNENHFLENFLSTLQTRLTFLDETVFNQYSDIIDELKLFLGNLDESKKVHSNLTHLDQALQILPKVKKSLRDRIEQEDKKGFSGTLKLAQELKNFKKISDVNDQLSEIHPFSQTLSAIEAIGEIFDTLSKTQGRKLQFESFGIYFKAKVFLPFFENKQKLEALNLQADSLADKIQKLKSIIKKTKKLSKGIQPDVQTVADSTDAPKELIQSCSRIDSPQSGSSLEMKASSSAGEMTFASPVSAQKDEGEKFHLVEGKDDEGMIEEALEEAQEEDSEKDEDVFYEPENLERFEIRKNATSFLKTLADEKDKNQIRSLIRGRYLKQLESLYSKGRTKVRMKDLIQLVKRCSGSVQHLGSSHIQITVLGETAFGWIPHKPGASCSKIQEPGTIRRGVLEPFRKAFRGVAQLAGIDTDT